MNLSIIPGRMITDSSLASLKQKSISSLISSRSERFSFTCIAMKAINKNANMVAFIQCSRKFQQCYELTIIAIDPSGFWGQKMQGISSISLQHTSEVSLNMLSVFLKKTSSVSWIIRGTAACYIRTSISWMQSRSNQFT